MRNRPMEVRERGLMPTEREAALRAGGEAELNVLDDWKSSSFTVPSSSAKRAQTRDATGPESLPPPRLHTASGTPWRR
jgi:hypothetical protein